MLPDLAGLLGLLAIWNMMLVADMPAGLPAFDQKRALQLSAGAWS